LEIAKIERQAKAPFAKQSTSRAEGAPYKPPFFVPPKAEKGNHPEKWL
jgi:hypothetical protein